MNKTALTAAVDGLQHFGLPGKAKIFTAIPFSYEIKKFKKDVTAHELLEGLKGQMLCILPPPKKSTSDSGQEIGNNHIWCWLPTRNMRFEEQD